MYQLVLESNHEITKRLELNNLYNVLLVNKKLSLCVNEPNFWRLKLEHDYNILNKKPNQTWFERYKLALSMGYICFPDIPNNPVLPFDIGESFNIGLGFIGQYSNCDTRLLNIKAINAVLMRPGLYYLTDELTLYLSGKRNYDDDIVYENELIDTNVTYITASLSLVLYIKNDDLYIYTEKHEKTRLTYTEDIIQVSAVYNDISYVTKYGICYKIDEYGTHTVVESNIAKVIAADDGLLILTKDNKFKMIGNFDKSDDIPSDGIIDMFGYIILLTLNNDIISFECISESDIDDKLTASCFTRCNDFKNITNIITAVEDNSGKFCLTKNGNVYYSLKMEGNLKLSVKAKNIFDSPDAVILIV
jgi:hypothetical protein